MDGIATTVSLPANNRMLPISDPWVVSGISEATPQYRKRAGEHPVKPRDLCGTRLMRLYLASQSRDWVITTDYTSTTHGYNNTI